MADNNQAQTDITETASVNPTIIIALFIVIGSFFVLSTTLDSIFSVFSWFMTGLYWEYAQVYVIKAIFKNIDHIIFNDLNYLPL